jgi:transposase InsO family protein
MSINNRDTDNLIHHSDRGIWYTCKEYINIFNAHHIRISMSAKSNFCDNTLIESFFKTLKQEDVYLGEYENFSNVISRIPYFIEDVYNKKRLHSSLGCYRPSD